MIYAAGSCVALLIFRSEITVAMIHLIPTFHYDVIYLKSEAEYLNIGCDIINCALTLLQKYPEYRFTIEQVYLIEEFCRRNPGEISTIAKLVQDKRISFAPGMYVMPDMNFCDGESMYLQVKFGRKILQELFGAADEDSDACWIADCWGHHAQLPQIISQCCYKHYFFMRGMDPALMQKECLWQGIDGTELPATWLSCGYAGVRFGNSRYDNALELCFGGISAADINCTRKDIMQYGPNQQDVLIGNGGDNCFPQEEACLAVEKLNQSGSLDDQICFSVPSDYAAGLDKAKMPRFAGEFNGLFEGSYTANIWIKQRTDAARRKLLALEKFNAMQGNTADFEHIWRRILKLQFHDIIMGTVCDAGIREIEAELEAAEQALAEAAGTPMAFFNPLAQSREEIAELPDGRRFRVIVGPLGKRALAECEELSPEKQPLSLPLTFSNGYFSSVWNEKGYCSSLTDRDGKEMIAAAPCPFGALTMQIDNGDNWLNFTSPLDGGSFLSKLSWPDHKDPYEQPPQLCTNNRTLLANICGVEAFAYPDGTVEIIQQGRIDFWRIGVSFVTRITLEKNSPYVKYRTELLPKGRHYRIRAAFPAAFSDGTVRRGIPFGMQESRRTELPSSGFLDFRKTGMACSLFFKGTYGASTDDDGIMLLSLFRAVAMEYKCQSFASYNEGRKHTYEYAVAPGMVLDAVPSMAEAYQNELLFCADAELSSFPGLPENVTLSALRRHADGRYFLRLVENAGKESSFELDLPGTLFAADGLERETGAFNGSKVALRPFQILNLLWENK